MTSGAQQEETQQNRAEASADQLVAGAADVVMAAMGVGAALARIAAQATAGSRLVPEPPRADNPLNVMVHYGAVAVANVTDAVLAGISEARAARMMGQPGRPVSSAGSTQTEAPSIPTVHQGSSLRMPLSIENPTTEPMRDMHFTCLAIYGGSELDGAPLTPGAVRFEPAELSIESKDFDKLTVFIDVPEDTAPGKYEVTIGLRDGTFETTIPFLVNQA